MIPEHNARQLEPSPEVTGTVRLHVPEMHCGGCEAAIRRALATLAGEVAVDLQARTVDVVLATGVAAEAIRGAIESAGFDVSDTTSSG